MKRFLINAAAFMTMAAMVSCGNEPEAPSQGSKTGFALSFFKNVNAIVEKGENVVVSPYSAGVALSMLAEGAEGETRAEFDNALNGCIFKAEDLGNNDTITVKSSNSVWIDNDFSIRNSYMNLLEKDFDAFIDALSFADPATVKAINDWCTENTNGKIDEIIDRLDPSAVMVLVNALYFNAPWEDEFSPSLTKEADFHGVTKNSKVQMMSRSARMNYAEYYGCQMVELPYAGGRYSMIVILPPAGMDADAMMQYIGESIYDMAMGMFQPRQVRLKMPKAKIETSLILNQALKNMGVRSAFTPAADFKGIAAMGPLVLDQVKQKCYIDISEKGTEAAAVTSAQIRLTSARPEAEPVEMTVDRPYLFIITDKTNDNILFAGKIVNL
jgi:serpin B